MMYGGSPREGLTKGAKDCNAHILVVHLEASAVYGTDGSCQDSIFREKNAVGMDWRLGISNTTFLRFLRTLMAHGPAFQKCRVLGLKILDIPDIPDILDCLK